MKEKYIEYANNNFSDKALELVLNQIELFYKDVSIDKNKYNIGDRVLLKRGTFLHGIQGGVDRLDWIFNNGFISSNFVGSNKPNKLFNSVGVWNIKEDILLGDYIKLYSGITIGYRVDRGPSSKRLSKLVPFGEIENEINKLNNDKEVWMWNAEQTKEIRFMPSLASNKVNIDFILNMDSEYAKKLKYADLFNKEFDKDILKYFVVENYLDKFINEEKDSFTTDRESAIMFGLPSILVEGIIVGRELESDKESLEYIKSIFKDVYICNLDGVVIM